MLHVIVVGGDLIVGNCRDENRICQVLRSRRGGRTEDRHCVGEYLRGSRDESSQIPLDSAVGNRIGGVGVDESAVRSRPTDVRYVRGVRVQHVIHDDTVGD